jgi:alpha-beta hydrolase superfamily lysophospholipase
LDLLGGSLRHAFKPIDLAAALPWSSYVSANSLTPRSDVPVLIAQTQADPLVAPAVTRQFARRLCANRVAVRWIDLPGKDSTPVFAACFGGQS